MTPGLRNLISDVPGLKVGNAHCEKTRSGVTVLIPDQQAVASVAIMGGAPGTRDVALLEPEQTVNAIDALVLAGGSAYGLDAGSGAQVRLAELGKGFAVGSAIIPITPTAILFDLLNGGDKSWGRNPVYRDMGIDAVDNAGIDFEIGTAGAGFGATTADLKGGLGSASLQLPRGGTVGSLIAVNALGRTTIGDTPYFWAAPSEYKEEFGGRGWPSKMPGMDKTVQTKYSLGTIDLSPNTNTTIGIVATDLILAKSEAKRVATAAHDGFARALWPAHTPMDGDLLFVLSTGKRAMNDPLVELLELGAYAAQTVSRAIARGVYCASERDGDTVPTWKKAHGS
ncbi:P1 family peptidase [Pseudovibrio sp. Tun.PSC04-5.I4]|uniref:P1 family peptidase n=1 Tax=Pseudovibrio sp. Tun.PSC04-5.I4 TaxID=1798213 RepID=UPI00088075CC|nr:P1 family peptidase [Pseudovibrio sp. Tun.PSC04-5.I4]SDR37575.1 L-aminopeptidase/D-esterase [Pseudovibrio sp. Tun.PSC04-5.I4]